MPLSSFYEIAARPHTCASRKKSTRLSQIFMCVCVLCLNFRLASPAVTPSIVSSNSSVSQIVSATNRTSVSLCQPGCLNHGTCEANPLTKEASCTCPQADSGTSIYFRGSSCQIEAVRCNETFWCENGGLCQASSGSQEFTCACTGAFQVRKSPYRCSV